jgi:hypothetical protein
MPTWRQGTNSDNPDNACLTAVFRSGNNALTGPWEYSMTGQSGNAIAEQYAWGTSSGYLNSGQVSAGLNVGIGGGANSVTWEIGNGNTISYGSQAYGNIIEVGFYVAVDGNQTVEIIEWQSLTITFYDANNNSSALDVPSNELPSATVASGSAYWIAVPDSTFTAVRVVVSGTVFLNASSPTPGPNALLGNIYVWTSTCTND